PGTRAGRCAGARRAARARWIGTERSSHSGSFGGLGGRSFIVDRTVSPSVASPLWARLTWSRALFAVLVLNVVWTASLFVCPYLVHPGSFPTSDVASQVGGANLVDHENIWATFPIYPRIIYTIGDAQCHQLPYRTFWLNGNEMPIDERMTSMYVFANLGLIAAIFARPSTSTGQVMLNAF